MNHADCDALAITIAVAAGLCDEWPEAEQPHGGEVQRRSGFNCEDAKMTVLLIKTFQTTLQTRRFTLALSTQ